MNIVISVVNRVATPPDNAVIVCGNSDYTLTFDFDAEWSAETVKIARYVWFSKNKTHSEEITFEGNTVEVPILSNTNAVYVGVYAGNLRTTTPAKIVCEPSILCYGQEAQGNPSDMALIKGQIAELINALKNINADPAAIKNAVTEYLSKNPPKVTETDPTVPAWAKAEKKPTYTATEVGALSKDEFNSAVNTALEQAKASGKFDGADGNDGQDYILTPEDKDEIAELVARLVEVPDSGGNVDGAVLYTAQELSEEQQEQARDNIGIKEPLVLSTSEATPEQVALALLQGYNIVLRHDDPTYGEIYFTGLMFIPALAAVASSGVQEYHINDELAIMRFSLVGSTINEKWKFTYSQLAEYSDIPESGGNADQSGGGMSATASALLITILRNGVYTSDQSANIDALEAALAASGDTPDEPVEPDLPEVDVSQTGSILSIVSGVTVSQSGSVLAIA